jgi:hypothetical protein
MIQLTDQQIHELENLEAIPPRAVNPHTNETFILLRVSEYERLKEHEYDDSPWTRKDLESAAWHTAEGTAWDEYDDVPDGA